MNENNEELNSILPTNELITIQGKQFHIRFGMSAWAQLEKKYGSLENLKNIETEFKERCISSLLELMWIGIVEKNEIETLGLNKDNFLDEYSLNDMEWILPKLERAFYNSSNVKDNKKKVGV